MTGDALLSRDPRHPTRALEDVTLERFAAEFDPGIRVLPYTVCLLGFSGASGGWRLAGFEGWSGHGRERIDPLVRFLDRFVIPHMSGQPFWLMVNHWDGWREGAVPSDRYRWVEATEGIYSVDDWALAAGEIPVLSNRRSWVACFGAHRNDPSALLVPEAHYLHRLYYRPMFLQLRVEHRAWSRKLPRGCFAGGNHGPTRHGNNLRQELQKVVERENLPIDVRLGQRVSRREQMRYRYLLDVDGWVRTWDAWAWKLRSGSVVLSPSSPWDTFFTELFVAWEHFVPVANDFSDLGERLEWCQANDRECREISRRASERAGQVYRPTWAGRRLADKLEAKLAEPRPASWITAAP